MNEDHISQDALTQADRTTNEFSAYQGALGQTGVKAFDAPKTASYLGNAGDSVALTPGPDGLGTIYVGCSWNVQKAVRTGFWGQLFGPKKQIIDIDLGCLYELTDGTRGALQALGAEDGALDRPPFIRLSHDERTGLAEGDDEYMHINGAQWGSIKRVLIYAYIYSGAPDWSFVRPAVTIRVPGQADAVITPAIGRQSLGVCALAMIEQIRGGLKLTNLTEYFPGQPELDRAYGFGVNWSDGHKV